MYCRNYAVSAVVSIPAVKSQNIAFSLSFFILIKFFSWILEINIHEIRTNLIINPCE